MSADIVFSGHALTQKTEEMTVTCVICKQGETKPGTVVVSLERTGSIVVIKNAPAEVCDNCGEYYLSDAVADKVMRLAESAVGRGAEIEIMRYAA